jgi:amino acid permease
VGVVLFCFTGHASLPELYHHMRPAERCHFDRAVNVGHSSGR